MAVPVVTEHAPGVGYPGDTPGAGAGRAWHRNPINRLVVAVIGLGIGLASVMIAGFPQRIGVLNPHPGPPLWLLLVLIGATCLGELTVVRLRHGEATEELTLCEAAILVDVLLLPAREALIAAVVGLLVAYLVHRRAVVKAAFNLGMYTAATAALIGVVHLVAGTPGRVTVGLVAGVLLGTCVFTAVNLCCLAQIIGVVSEASPWRVVRSEARLSAYMAFGTVATGLPAAEIGLHAPLLLPFIAMPALALTYAYRAAAQEADERARSACLLKLSHALAERDDVVPRFLVLVREAFDADHAVVVLEQDGPAQEGVAYLVDAAVPTKLSSEPIPDHLTMRLNVDRPALVTDDLPPNIRQMLVVPLESDGRRFGIAALGFGGRAISGRPFGGRRNRQLSTRDLTLLAPLANALAAAMRGAEHLDRLVEETSKLHAVVAQSTEGILMLDGEGAVQMWSRAFAELTDVTSAEAAGCRLVDLLDVPDPAERGLLLPVTADNPRAVVELTIRRPDGELRRLRLAHSAVFADGVLVRDVVVVRDLSREYRTERLKSDFIATVSHELRTPLTPIIGYVDLLRTRSEQMPADKRQKALALIADRASHMSRLVEDLLLASRMGDGDSDVELNVSMGTHDLAAIVRQIVDDLDTERIKVALPGHPVPVRCDAGRALQVATNLIGNALKYSPATEDVQVSMWLEDDRVHVDVADRGRGIPADQLDKVFEKFHRVEDPMTMSTSGTGLGLFIARRLARAMDGDVGVASTLNVGSVFTFTLCRAESAGAEVEAAQPGASSSATAGR